MDGLPRLQAVRETIQPDFFPQHEITLSKVDALETYMLGGGSVPPVVVVRYDDRMLPLDGHHRLMAARRLGKILDAWVVDGEAFEDLDNEARLHDLRAEDCVYCGSLPYRQVACAL